MPKSNNVEKILLDSDVIRHFIKGQQLQILPQLYKKLLTEAECDNMIKSVKNKGSKLPVDSLREYHNLKKKRIDS